MSVLRAEQLTKSFNHRIVVKGVDIEVRSGEIIGLLGINGAGKTTTFQMIVGLIRPEGGDIFLGDKNISRYSSPNRATAGITYLPQEHSVFLKASVMNNLMLILELQPLKKKERVEIAQKLLEELGLSSISKQQAYSLSGGERRRLEICRSLVLNPKFLLLDEPFTGIDPLTIVELQKIMTRLKKKGIGIIISDHNVRDTLGVCDKAYILCDGEIIESGSPQKIANSEAACRVYLGDEFRL